MSPYTPAARGDHGRTVDLLVPVKSLARAKTRLRGAADNGVGDPGAHARLAMAMVRDTLAVARSAPGVRRVFVVTSDPEVTGALAADVPTLPDHPQRGLNEALRHAAELLRAEPGPRAPLGALQADLPALRAEELAEAVATSLSAFRAGLAERAFCPDAGGTGTTLLLCTADTELDPEFGPDSAAAHQRGGALRLTGRWPGLRRDVDTPEDLRAAAALGLGENTRATLGHVTPIRARPDGL
ncbi:2-phospho-L-lactate guanylyltransferase [Pseudonocardia eucalypti]|uniref:Phosphoenolpyruvate guanylyltransferase n=1 Tax=Pseudonocardia eucalypti TaxID=648755 RepID=A0ABP9QA92_9PSEU|nr:2-phospho-L-lactate guanylyltransferase [Pseudonocardia eucalypti]